MHLQFFSKSRIASKYKIFLLSPWWFLPVADEMTGATLSLQTSDTCLPSWLSSTRANRGKTVYNIQCDSNKNTMRFQHFCCIVWRLEMSQHVSCCLPDSFYYFLFHSQSGDKFENLIDICWESGKTLTGVFRMIIKASLDLYLFVQYLLGGKIQFNLILTKPAILSARHEGREKKWINQRNDGNVWNI